MERHQPTTPRWPGLTGGLSHDYVPCIILPRLHILWIVPKIVDHDERRTSIARAAWRPIAELGVERTTLQAVAEEVGCTTGLLANYFDSKEALLNSSLELVVDQTLHRVAGLEPKTVDELLDFLALLLPTTPDRVLEWRVWTWFWARSLSEPLLAQRNRQLHADGSKLVLSALFSLQRAGTIHPNVDVKPTSIKISHAINGLGLDATFDPKAWPATRQRDHLASTIDDFLSSIGAFAS